jgi:Esterase PHB depolymerase
MPWPTCSTTGSTSSLDRPIARFCPRSGPAEDGPVACGDTGPPFVNDCDLDQAREALAFLQGSLNPPGTPSKPSRFDQRLYLPDPEPRGMAETGWVYVPAGCARGDPCRVHVVFHGCKQGAELVGEAVTVGAGYNRWAETNGIVVLYPQAHATWSNPNACWDWWGYTGEAYGTKRGVQPAAVHRMLLALAGRAGDGDDPACVRHHDWNLTHWRRGRAIACGWGFACAAGSGEILGPFVASSEVYEHPGGFYTTEPCRG